MRNKSFAWLGIVLFFSTFAYAQEIAQWRGEHRDGVYFEDKLLKTWPENGPDLLWSTETIGDGYGSVAVSSDMLFVCGKQDSLSMTYAFDRNGNMLWKTPNGLEFTGVDFTANFPGPRSTPTLWSITCCMLVRVTGE
jgi:outer membrane protein assembly factor BamB